MKDTVMPVRTEESKAKDKKYEDYDISNAVDSLMRAEEIRDKMEDEPEFGRLVNAQLSKKSKALNKITSLDQLRDKANEPDDELEEDDEEESEE